MVAVYCGNQWNPETGNTGAPVVVDLESNFQLIAPPGSGKGAALEIPNLLLGLRGCSVVSIDPSGQNAAVCAEARRRAGNRVLPVNPLGMHVDRYPDLRSVGCNPMAGISSRSRLFYQEAAAIGEALIKLENDSQIHFPQSARGLVTGLVMWEVLRAERERRAPLLENVRTMLCEAEQTNADGTLRAGLRYHAACMVDSGHWQIADLAGRYIRDGSREIDSIISTARTQTEWLLSEPMRADLRRNGVDWAQLFDVPTTVFVIVPAEYLETQEGSVWLRLMVMSALRPLYGLAGEHRVKEVLFLLSEFPALKKLTAAESLRSQGRKYGLRAGFVTQDIHQIRDIYGPHGAESFSGQCDAVFAFAPGEWESAEWMSRRSCEENFVSMHASQSSDRPGVNFNYSVQRRRAWPPERILSLPEYHGLVWLQRQAQAVPVYAAPYFEQPACMAVARPDPYHDSGPGPAYFPARSRPVFPPRSAAPRSAPPPIAAPSDLEQRAMRLLGGRINAQARRPTS
jgi:type IV secretory pathway TraG/TraD family ATPase VirD4